jgi:hypothetical protein
VKRVSKKYALGWFIKRDRRSMHRGVGGEPSSIATDVGCRSTIGQHHLSRRIACWKRTYSASQRPDGAIGPMSRGLGSLDDGKAKKQKRIISLQHRKRQFPKAPPPKPTTSLHSLLSVAFVPFLLPSHRWYSLASQGYCNARRALWARMVPRRRDGARNMC